MNINTVRKIILFLVLVSFAGIAYGSFILFMGIVSWITNANSPSLIVGINFICFGIIFLCLLMMYVIRYDHEISEKIAEELEKQKERKHEKGHR